MRRVVLGRDIVDRRRGCAAEVPTGRWDTVCEATGVKVAFEGIAVSDPRGSVDTDPPRTLPPGACVPILHEHVALAEVAGGEVEIGAVHRHQLREKKRVHLGLCVVEMVAVNKNAAFGRMAVNVNIHKQFRFSVFWRKGWSPFKIGRTNRIVFTASSRGWFTELFNCIQLFWLCWDRTQSPQKVRPRVHLGVQRFRHQAIKPGGLLHVSGDGVEGEVRDTLVPLGAAAVLRHLVPLGPVVRLEGREGRERG